MSRNKGKKKMESENRVTGEEIREEKNTEEEVSEMPVEETGIEEENTEENTTEEHKKTELEEAQAKAAEYLAMAQRIQADFENYRKRNEKVRADAYADGRRDVAASLLNVLDNLERAVEAAGKGSDEALLNGVQLVLRQMNETYQKMDVTPIDRLGEKFDPNLENAVLQGSQDEGDPGTVCQVLQKGYKMGDRVLRHAMVKVVPE